MAPVWQAEGVQRHLPLAALTLVGACNPSPDGVTFDAGTDGSTSGTPGSAGSTAADTSSTSTGEPTGNDSTESSIES